MKKLLHSLNTRQILLFLLYMVVLLPIAIDVLHQFYTNGQIDIEELLFDLGVILATLMVLSYPVYRLLTRLNKSEFQRSETKRNVAELIDHAADMILVTRPNGEIVHANRKASELLGYSIDELRNMKNMDVDIDCYMYNNPKLHQRLYSGQSVTFETLYKTKTGKKIPVENHISIAGWMDGTHYLEITRDITRRRQVERELHASKEALERVRNRLESRMQEGTEKLVKEVQKREMTERRIYEIRLLLENLVNSMPSVIIALDSKLKVTQWNLEAEKVFGVLEVAAIGKNVAQLLPQFRSTIFKLIRRSDLGRKSLKQTVSIELDGRRRQYDVMLYPLSQTASAESPGVVIRLDDITEKARFDEMLVQTEKMLSLGGLAAGMAHEINNPLGAILQSSQNIERRLTGDLPRNQKIADKFNLDLNNLRCYLEEQKITQSIDAIQEAGQRAATIVTDMLSFARPGGSEKALVDVVEALQSSIRLAEKDYNQKRNFDFRNIKIETYYDAGLPMIHAQKNQLNQVFLNLLINAAQALSSVKGLERPTIKVSAKLDNQNVRVDIRDNGPGMDEQTRRRVFEPFFTTKEEGAGTGLGLSVSYFIVTEQLGGQLRVDSTPGKNTCFTMLLPISDTQQESKPTTSDSQIQLPLDSPP